jgi:hypothetical protein
MASDIEQKTPESSDLEPNQVTKQAIDASHEAPVTESLSYRMAVRERIPDLLHLSQSHYRRMAAII